MMMTDDDDMTLILMIEGLASQMQPRISANIDENVCTRAPIINIDHQLLIINIDHQYRSTILIINIYMLSPSSALLKVSHSGFLADSMMRHLLTSIDPIFACMYLYMGQYGYSSSSSNSSSSSSSSSRSSGSSCCRSSSIVIEVVVVEVVVDVVEAVRT